jgi:organic radical activating enzyme
MFYTLQGEGVRTGRAAVFCRFAGCNLWSGREEDRAGAVCRFCDTEFVGVDGPGGGRFAMPDALAAAVADLWPGGGVPYVVCTGGEPLLQLDAPLIDAFHDPKAGADVVLRAGDELKLVYPQEGAAPGRYEDLTFRHFLLQPMDGPEREANTRLALDYCLEHPRWRLSLQTHKILGIP